MGNQINFRANALNLLHSEQPKLYGVLALLSAIGLNILTEFCPIKTGFIAIFDIRNNWMQKQI